MKNKILILLIAFLLTGTVSGYANTYESILKDNGYTDIHNNYINKTELKSIISLVFKQDIDYELSGVGHATGYDFFMLIEELGYKDCIIANKEIYYNRALTYLSLYELFDWYFYEISSIHNIKSYSGKLSKGSSGYTLTYGNGMVEEFLEFNFFKTKESYLDVFVIVKNDMIIDICEMERNIPFSMLSGKKEITGKLYLLYDEGIIIESDGELMEFPITENFKLLNKKGDNIVVFTGNYKKNMDIAAVAVGRND